MHRLAVPHAFRRRTGPDAMDRRPRRRDVRVARGAKPVCRGVLGRRRRERAVAFPGELEYDAVPTGADTVTIDVAGTPTITPNSATAMPGRSRR